MEITMCKEVEQADDWTPVVWQDLRNGDCWEVIKTLEDTSVDAIITDPPYDIGFMNKGWDKNSLITNTEFWKECLRVLKPGGHLLAFGHSRTSHRTVSAIEDAGFEIRDTIMWIYGSGFPKSHNVAIAIDKKHGAMKHRGVRSSFNGQRNQEGEDIPPAVAMPQHQAITDAAKPWQGWGSALKPAHEPIVLARKPLEGTLADNCEKWMVGGLNIDATRIGEEKVVAHHAPAGTFAGGEEDRGSDKNYYSHTGRFPANVMFGHHEDCEEAGETEETVIGGNKGKSGFAEGYEAGDYTKKQMKVPVWKCVDGCPVKELDRQAPNKGNLFSTKRKKKTTGGSGDSWTNGGKDAGEENGFYDAPSGASKFFYCSKVGKKERNKGLDELPDKNGGCFVGNNVETQASGNKIGANPSKPVAPTKNNHPTVKPIALMEYLIKMVTQRDAVVLDPFMGSGTTGIAAKNLYRNFIGIEREQAYYDIAHKRIGVEDEE